MKNFFDFLCKSSSIKIMETISSLIGFIGILLLVSLPVLAFGGLIAWAIPRLSRYFETSQK
jgi:hypothetical protein